MFLAKFNPRSIFSVKTALDRPCSVSLAKLSRITSYNVCYTKLLRYRETPQELNSLITSLNFFIGLFAFCICALFYFVGPFIFSTNFPYSPYFPLTFATLWLMVMNQLTMSFLIPQKRHMKYLSLQILQFALITIASRITSYNVCYTKLLRL